MWGKEPPFKWQGDIHPDNEAIKVGKNKNFKRKMIENAAR